MTDFLYDNYGNGLLDPAAATLLPIAALSATLGLALIDGTIYTPSQSGDVSVADIPSLAILALTTVTGVSISGRALHGSATWTAVPIGPDGTGAVLYKVGGSDATSPLMAWLDAAAGLPVTPDGTDIVVNFDAAGILHF